MELSSGALASAGMFAGASAAKGALESAKKLHLENDYAAPTPGKIALEEHFASLHI